ncbi:hypothetical protein D6817_03515 [Candidatus Pacearchaeota archaeon]|nr:MAG: hypothetical protein D6817_03515 [Candidatus Pacearchaeota archaeon]
MNRKGKKAQVAHFLTLVGAVALIAFTLWVLMTFSADTSDKSEVWANLISSVSIWEQYAEKKLAAIASDSVVCAWLNSKSAQGKSESAQRKIVSDNLVRCLSLLSKNQERIFPEVGNIFGRIRNKEFALGLSISQAEMEDRILAPPGPDVGIVYNAGRNVLMVSLPNQRAELETFKALGVEFIFSNLRNELASEYKKIFPIELKIQNAASNLPDGTSISYFQPRLEKFASIAGKGVLVFRAKYVEKGAGKDEYYTSTFLLTEDGKLYRTAKIPYVPFSDSSSLTRQILNQEGWLKLHDSRNGEELRKALANGERLKLAIDDLTKEKIPYDALAILDDIQKKALKLNSLEEQGGKVGGYELAKFSGSSRKTLYRLVKDGKPTEVFIEIEKKADSQGELAITNYLVYVPKLAFNPSRAVDDRDRLPYEDHDDVPEPVQIFHGEQVMIGEIDKAMKQEEKKIASKARAVNYIDFDGKEREFFVCLHPGASRWELVGNLKSSVREGESCASPVLRQFQGEGKFEISVPDLFVQTSWGDEKIVRKLHACVEIDASGGFAGFCEDK